MTTPLEAARAYLAQGWFPIPVPWRQKAPLLDGWLQLRLTAKTVADYFNGSPQNVGILLGQLTDVDCDAPEAIAGAPEYLPPTPAIHGRPSKRRSHWWYRRAQAQPTVQFRNTDTTMLVELRGEGGHTLVWPSVHPSGEPITWEGQGDPAQVDAHELEVAVTRLAAMALLARHWPKQAGSRHQLALSLAGFLLRGELDEELSARVIGSAARIAKDPEWRDRIMAVRTTARRLAAGEACVTTFERVIPDGAVIQGLLTPWLRLRVPHPRLTDLGNAERFIAQHGEDVRYCYPFRSWFVWNGTRWWKDPGDAITRLGKATVRTIYSEAADARDPEDRKAIVAWALKSESAERLRAMLELARSEVAVLPEAFDRDPYLLNCPNGTLELRTGALRAHRREDLITKMTAAPYDPEATHPRWTAFLEVALPDAELRAYMQRLAGYCLTGDTREEQWWLKYGPTLGGKTTWTSSLQETWGDYAIAVDFQTFAIQKIESSAPREDIARLHGPRLVVSSEVRKGVRISEGLIKQLTGGDRLTAHRKYEHQFDFVPRCKLMVAANYRPQVRDDDSAIWRRIVEVPFTQSIPNPDPAIKATLTDPSKAGPAILAWAVQGATDWFAGGLQPPNAIKESTAAYRAAMNPLADFFRERCVFEKRATVRAGELKDAYLEWARTHGVKDLLSPNEVAVRLRERGCEPGKNDRSTRIWIGVRLLTDEDDPEPATAETSETTVSGNFSTHARREESSGKVVSPPSPLEGGVSDPPGAGGEAPAPPEPPPTGAPEPPSEAETGAVPDARDPQDDARDPQPPAGDDEPLTTEVVAAVPVMITHQMARDLCALGYADAAISGMRPEQAHGILARGTPAPPPSPVQAVDGIEAESGVVGGIDHEVLGSSGANGATEELPPGAEVAEPEPVARQEPDPALMALATARLTPSRYVVAIAAARNIRLEPESAEVQGLARRLMANEQHLQAVIATRQSGLLRREAVRLFGAPDRPADERLSPDLALALIVARAGRAWRVDGGVLWPIGATQVCRPQ